jgi:hypothetical protein
VKISRPDDESGKGGYWALNEKYKPFFVDGIFQKPRRLSINKSLKSSSGFSVCHLFSESHIDA